jgi:hypothetical protein
VPAAAAVGAHRDALDVARPQRPPAVEQPPLDHGPVPDQLVAVPHQRVDAAQAVLPVVVAPVVLEDGLEERPRGGELRGGEIGGVGGAELGHPAFAWAT